VIRSFDDRLKRLFCLLTREFPKDFLEISLSLSLRARAHIYFYNFKNLIDFIADPFPGSDEKLHAVAGEKHLLVPSRQVFNSLQELFDVFFVDVLFLDGVDRGADVRGERVSAFCR